VLTNQGPSKPYHSGQHHYRLQGKLWNKDKHLKIPQKIPTLPLNIVQKFVQKLVILKESACSTNGLPMKVYSFCGYKNLAQGVSPWKNGWETLIYTA